MLHQSGKATAYAFAKADAKAFALCGRRLAPLEAVKAKIEAKHPSAKAIVLFLEIVSEREVDPVFTDFCVREGPTDILVNSAGHKSDKGTIAETTLVNCWESLETTCKKAASSSHSIPQNHNTSTHADPVLISMNGLVAHMLASQIKTAPASYASSKMAQGKMIEYAASKNRGS